MFTKKTSLVIPTRNRPRYLKKTLKQIYDSKIQFLEIIVIDSSEKNFKQKVREIIDSYDIVFYNSIASTSVQRNIGIQKSSNKSHFIMFLDDDIIFFKDMFFEMNKTIQNIKDKNVIGYGFNQIQKTTQRNFFLEKLKKNMFFNNLGLYPSKSGSISLSGWHSPIINISKDKYVDWIYTTACIFKTVEIKKLKFDETFGNYGYLEDLDFSLNFYRTKKKILISSNAKYIHPLTIDRSSFNFGIIEVRNRYKIVKKYNLSIMRFFSMSLIRLIIFFLNIFLLRKNLFLRSLGNIFGLILINIKKR